MPKTSVSSSNAFVGFMWWFHMWGHSVVDPLFARASRVSIWSDFEEMMSDFPWYVGVVFWLGPVLFFWLLFVMSLYAMVFAGLWLGGILAFVIGKFMGSGWFRYGQKVMHPVLAQMPWYADMHAKLAKSKKAGLKAYRATALSKWFSGVYNKAMVVVTRQKDLVRERIRQHHDKHN